MKKQGAMNNSLLILQGNCFETLKTLPHKSVHCCVTSPPYWGLRDYGCKEQIGLETTPQEYVNNISDVFRMVYDVLRDDGTLWLNLGDGYNGSGKGESSNKKQNSNAGSRTVVGRKTEATGLKPKNLVGIPWRVAFALQSEGWYLRSDIIWHKPNPMPESVKDRPTKAHEYIFMFSKSERYFYDCESIKEPSVYRDDRIRDRENTRLNNVPGRTRMGGLTRNNYEWRNKRDVWTVQTQPCKEAHFAVFPEKLIEPCILAGCPVGGVVLDPFAGSGTTGRVALKVGRKAILCELNPQYIPIINRRTNVSLELALSSGGNQGAHEKGFDASNN